MFRHLGLAMRPRLRFLGEDDGANGGGGDAAAQAAAATAAADAAKDDHADFDFPDKTAVSEMTPVQAAEYWRHKARKHEDRNASMGDYTALKAAAVELAELKRQGLTDSEKAIADARAEGLNAGRSEATSATAPRLVAAEFRATVAGRIPADRLAAILDPLDLTKFLTPEGEVDPAKVSAYVDGLAPVGGTKWPDMGQGRRESHKATGVGAGAAMFAERKK